MERQYFYYLIFFLLFHYSDAQVGINTSNPAAALHINNISDNEKNGIILPQLDEFPVTMTSDQDSMMIYITGNGSVNKGYWFYEHGSGWRKLIDSTSAESLQMYRNPKFPDGMKGIQPITYDLKTGGYSVPVGKNLYITSLFNSRNIGNMIVLDYTTSLNFTLISNTEASYTFPTFNNPILVAQNDLLSGTFVFNGFLVDATVDPIYTFSSYTVPANKIFIYLTSNNNSSPLPIAEIRIGTTAVTQSGTNNSRSGNVEALAMPLFIDAGETINNMQSGSTMNGYLIDK